LEDSVFKWVCTPLCTLGVCTIKCQHRAEKLRAKSLFNNRMEAPTHPVNCLHTCQKSEEDPILQTQPETKARSQDNLETHAGIFIYRAVWTELRIPINTWDVWLFPKTTCPITFKSFFLKNLLKAYILRVSCLDFSHSDSFFFLPCWGSNPGPCPRSASLSCYTQARSTRASKNKLKHKVEYMEEFWRLTT
jgi:hypothetical protein